jgi:hypothetical protein
MVGKDIYTNCGTMGQMEWPDGEAGQSGPTEKLDRATRVARNTQWASRADGHPDGCPMEGGRAPDGGGQVPDGGPTGARWRAHGCPTESGSGPTEGSMGAQWRAGSRGVAQRRVLGVAQRRTI